MARFSIMSALISEINSSGKNVPQCESKVILVFSAEDLRSPSLHRGVIIFRCSRFTIDEEMSVGNWKDAFECNTEDDDKVVITINPEYQSGIVIPYFG